MKPSEIFRKAVIHLMNTTNTKQSVLADSLDGFTRPNINSYLKGDRGISEDKRELIASFFNKTYLEMLNLGDRIVRQKNEVDAQNNLSAPIVIMATSDLDKKHLSENAVNYRSVPLFTSGRLAAWSNGVTFDQYEAPTSNVLVYTPELAHRANHKLVAVRVGGDSMEPLIPENSIIIIDMDDREYVDNKVFVIAVDEGGTQTGAVKRVRKFEEAEGFLLLSENQAYPPRIIKERNWFNLCVGRVIWMWRSFEG